MLNSYAGILLKIYGKMQKQLKLGEKMNENGGGYILWLFVGMALAKSLKMRPQLILFYLLAWQSFLLIFGKNSGFNIDVGNDGTINKKWQARSRKT